ncbi:uncharacterized protein LOC108622023 [Ceratina calcarata]|uniref:Uncharacterized protein LOC108622023 n=1 Tax=Ceratina calcarata TaxID=156304 RepID=A0AAJ7IRJ3_9HYME|nr:uncharacterized protein LOC108622023 [Ceratina calcarata]
MLSIGQIKLPVKKCELILQKTQLGWVIVGGIGNEEQNSVISCNLSSLSEQLARFWVIEDATSKSSKPAEELSCENHFAKTSIRHANGRYVGKLDSNPDLKIQYHKNMQEYIDLGHMSLATNENRDGYYMPHHAVIKVSSSTTKVRVVFDASAKTDKGISLNEMLMVVPSVQRKKQSL